MHILQNSEYSQSNHIMIDIETLCKGQLSVMPQISMVRFCPLTGETFETLDLKIDLQSMLDIGLTMDADTVLWWFAQDKEAINKVLLAQGTMSVHAALEQVKQFIVLSSTATTATNTKIWGNGPAFDLSKISAAFELIGQAKPWHYGNERCVRTISAFAPEFKKNMPFCGTKHDGLDDCRHQIKYVTAALQALMPTNE